MVSEEDTVSACSSLKGLWRWVGLLVDALLLVRSEAVERGPLMVSVRSPSAGARRWETACQGQLGALISGDLLSLPGKPNQGGPVSKAETPTC